MFLLCTICALMVFFPDTAYASSEMVQFVNFIQKFNKSYESAEEFQYRLSVFSNNLQQAKRLQREELGTAEYGVTKFSDLTAEEFRRYGIYSNGVLDLPNIKEATTAATFPKSRDWRTKGVISKVKDQKQCRSCWAFAVVGNIEAQWGIQGCPKNLSVQQVIDCGPCDDGCKGGYPWDAYITVLMQGGLVNESEYQYQAIRSTCRRDLHPAAWIYDFQMLPKNEENMASYVGNNGTLTVTINSVMLQHYKNGIIHTLHRNCDPDYVDHVVLIVGYVKGRTMAVGSQSEMSWRNGGTTMFNATHWKQKKEGKCLPYWIMKNSYGSDWGEKGYFRIFRGKNVCGITKYPLAATVLFHKGKHTSCPT
ncbi:cathepsin W-like [Pseudophryne corroboree]|uniref:cathepsin W-like n=1 Tax=Pseudophryne corroboree TaxID=495146 RepID=UPI003081B0AE